jgi:hypothetical protein
MDALKCCMSGSNPSQKRPPHSLCSCDSEASSEFDLFLGSIDSVKGLFEKKIKTGKQREAVNQA